MEQLPVNCCLQTLREANTPPSLLLDLLVIGPYLASFIALFLFLLYSKKSEAVVSSDEDEPECKRYNNNYMLNI